MRAAELMVREAASRYEAGEQVGAEASMAKMPAAPTPRGRRTTSACRTHGGFGFAEEYHVERKFCETRLYQVAPISTNLILSFLAERIAASPG
jgi:alkylation response protein AidB-like acyl-CoA dehydrogenase